MERELEKRSLEGRVTIPNHFEEDFAAFSSALQSFEDDLPLVRDLTTYSDVAQSLEIPQNLLTGPWTEDMTKFLYWLVKGGAKLCWLTSTTGEVSLAQLCSIYLRTNLDTGGYGRSRQRD